MAVHNDTMSVSTGSKFPADVLKAIQAKQTASALSEELR
jgi:hypothetical protein